MYIPRTNRWDDEEAVFRFLHAHPFALIVSNGPHGIEATHVPVEIEPSINGEPVIRTHIARANPQWRTFTSGEEILVVFTGPHAYISSSWYDHINVPTWNYLAVHIYGRVRILDHEETLASLNRLVARYEQGSKKPFSIEQMSEKDVHNHIKALVAFEISISRIDAKAKMSQNRDAHNIGLITAALEERGDEQSKAVKEAMEQMLKK